MMKFKVGDKVKQTHWNSWGTIIDIKPELMQVQGHVPGDLALWYFLHEAGEGIWEKQKPNFVKIGDEIYVPWNVDQGSYYSVEEIDPEGQVKLRHKISKSLAHGWYHLKDHPHWSINGVLCSEFFGVMQEDVAPPVDAPKRKKRIYNAISS